MRTRNRVQVQEKDKEKDGGREKRLAINSFRTKHGVLSRTGNLLAAYSSEYFRLDPRAASTGYFASFSRIFCSNALGRSMPAS